MSNLWFFLSLLNLGRVGTVGVVVGEFSVGEGDGLNSGCDAVQPPQRLTNGELSSRDGCE